MSSAEPAVAARTGPDRAALTRRVRDVGVYVAVAALLLFNAVFTDNFLELANLRTQLVQVAPVVIVALGIALVIGSEGIDLSVGSVMALAAAVLPLYLGFGLWPAVAMALLAGAAAGVLNGTLVAVVGLQPIVATLALLVAGRGLALVIADGQLKQIRNPDLLALGTDELLGLPVVAWVAVVLAVGIGFTVHRTTYGRQLVAIGGNRAAAQLAGLPVRRVLVVTYVLSGVFAALAGVLATARLTASDPSAIGNLIELSAITAVVVGGTPLSGGRVRVLGTVAGALLMQLLRATLIKHDLPDSTAQMVQAVIILVAVYVAQQRRTR
ncbi:ABC transporter permease [Micromonospora sp. URMC 105]|uniref:ABC transporter permease n=1 Tax=Micromonospora sp. URMC 105 TaxID=3423413 RepID=UPI003F1D2742